MEKAPSRREMSSAASVTVDIKSGQPVAHARDFLTNALPWKRPCDRKYGAKSLLSGFSSRTLKISLVSGYRMK